MKQITLSKSDIKELNSKIEVQLGKKEFFDKKDGIVCVDDKFILKNREPYFFYPDATKTRLVPALKALVKENFLKSVVVDMGAVKFVVGGADIMRPGIKAVDDSIAHDDFVAVVDETHKKPLAVGIAMFSSQEIMELKNGKVIKNIHHVGDEIWNFSV
jgi:PUA-domain protein